MFFRAIGIPDYPGLAVANGNTDGSQVDRPFSFDEMKRMMKETTIRTTNRMQSRPLLLFLTSCIYRWRRNSKPRRVSKPGPRHENSIFRNVTITTPHKSLVSKYPSPLCSSKTGHWVKRSDAFPLAVLRIRSVRPQQSVYDTTCNVALMRNRQ